MTGGKEQFRRASRLTKAVEFRRVFSRPNISQDRYFRVLCRANGLANSRLGLAVSKKACAQATGRNRLKRLIRESFRTSTLRPGETGKSGEAGEMGGIDIVVLPKRLAASMCNQTLTHALNMHWERCARFAAEQAAEGRN